MTNDYDAYGRRGIPLYTTQQPTQAQAGVELAEADRRAGAAERKLANCRENMARFIRVRDQMKDQWGVDRNVSFDVVWDEALKLKQQAEAITPPPIECNTEELKRAYAFGWWSALEKQRETAQAGVVPLTDEQIDAVALTLRRMPDWEPQFDCMTPKQEELALQFCQEIAGPRGKRGSPPDPVRLLEMAEALYKAEREHHHGIKGGQHGAE